MNHKPSIHYDICGVPPCVEVHRHHPLWGYVCPLLQEEYDWFQILKAESPFGALLNRYWPECIDLFFGWLDNHPEYQDEDYLRVIHGVESARRAFETFINPNSPSGLALWCTLQCWAEKHRSEPRLIGEILVPDVSQDIRLDVEEPKRRSFNTCHLRATYWSVFSVGMLVRDFGKNKIFNDNPH